MIIVYAKVNNYMVNVMDTKTEIKGERKVAQKMNQWRFKVIICFPIVS